MANRPKNRLRPNKNRTTARPVPTWDTAVRALFSQQEVAGMLGVRGDFDLGSYRFVRRHARLILRSVTPSSSDPAVSQLGIRLMPPPPSVPWNADKRAVFASWIASGCPERPSRIEPPPAGLERFLSLSRDLTGFDDLDATVAARHLRAALDSKHAESINSMLATPRASGASDSLPAAHPDACRYLILLWYASAEFDPNGFVARGSTGVPWENDYREGLVWRSCMAHPMGYSLEGYRHWENAPEADGLFSGLGVDPDV